MATKISFEELKIIFECLTIKSFYDEIKMKIKQIYINRSKNIKHLSSVLRLFLRVNLLFIFIFVHIIMMFDYYKFMC